MNRSVLLLLGLAQASFGGDDDVALQAGRIQLDATTAIEDGTILVQDGRIVAIGADVEVPRGVRVVDYGDDAVLSPGLVAADSYFGSSIAGPRTADPTLLAIDNFDPYSEMFGALRAGVTTAYMAPARGRLIAGQGAVVKTGGDADDNRVVLEVCMLQGAISAEARRTPGYWVPPVPATVDVGLGLVQRQLPTTTMGAVVALEEILALASGDEDLASEYGPETGSLLAAKIEAGTPWRMRADTPEEIRALLSFFKKAKLPLVLEGARGADEELAKEIAAAGVTVIAGPHTLGGADFGKSADSAGPNHALVSTLVAAGVDVVIASTRPEELRFTAALSQRGGGVDDAAAYHAITLGAAELLGVADRVGSLAVGKDADVAVFTGSPLDSSSQVIATWIEGELMHERSGSATVIEVEELHLGDGHVLRPGQILIRGGRIQEVGERVGHPSGCTVIRGAAAMPGMIDALGHLGLEGSRKRFSTRFDLSRIVEPGDDIDRGVARAGVTTVNLGGREAAGQTMLYKPAGDDPRAMVIDNMAAIRLTWSSSIPSARGVTVRKTLQKAKEYAAKWDKYYADLAAWTPPAPEAPEEEEEEEEEEDEDDKKKKAPAAPVTGEWEGTATIDDESFAVRLRLQEDADLQITGKAKSERFEGWMDVTGSRDEYDVELLVASPDGEIAVELELENDKMEGEGKIGEIESEVELTQTSKVYPSADRPVRERPTAPSAPKGKPKPPTLDAELEPIRQAMNGRGAVFINATSSRDAIEATEACAAIGVKPVIWSGDAAAGAASSLRGKVAGAVVRNSAATWAEWGVPVAFYSGAEEGAGELSLHVAEAVSRGLSPTAAVRALTSDAATMLGVGHRIGKLLPGMDADILLLDGSPFDLSSSVVRTWVDGQEIE